MTLMFPVVDRRQKVLHFFIQQVFQMEEFTRNADDNACLLGSHSICKCAATHVRPDVRVQPNWERYQGQVEIQRASSDIYDDLKLPHPDDTCSIIDDNIGNNIEMMNAFVLTQVFQRSANSYRIRVLWCLVKHFYGLFIAILLCLTTSFPRNSSIGSRLNEVKYLPLWVFTLMVRTSIRFVKCPW